MCADSVPSPDETLRPLAQRAGAAPRAGVDATLREVIALLEGDASAAGVLILDGQSPAAALSRENLERQLTRPFVRDLFIEKPVTEVIGEWCGAPLVVGPDAKLADVIDAALARRGHESYEPIIVAECDAMALVDMREALAAHNRLLAWRTGELETRRQEAERALEARTALIATMSHELRTPMTAILGYAELIQHGDEGVNAAREHAGVIRRSGEHLLTLLNSVLDLGRLEAGRIEIEQATYSPLAMLGDVVRLFEAQAGQNGIELRAEPVFPFPYTVRGDAMRMRQILSNLVSNAVKFTERGSVTVGARFVPDGDGASLRFEVSDTGIGIDPDRLEGLFAPYTQAEASTARRFGGSGLGLFLSSQIAERMGGRIEARSEPGEGSVFTLTVPLPRATPVLLAHGPERATHGATAGNDNEQERRLEARILLAEDGGDNKRLIAAFLERAGASVVAVDDGADAIRAAREQDIPFDLILLDVEMAGVGGPEALRELRAIGVGAPILALTAHAMKGDRERCLDAGFDDYLAKPVDRASLLDLCGRWLARERRSVA